MALAMGADRALHVVCDEYLDHRLVARALAGAIKSDGSPTVVFAGRQAIDDDASQVHLRLAHLLGIAAATDVREFAYDETGVSVTREIEEGALEKLALAAPAMVAVARGINTPRYPTLPNIMKAKRKEIKQLSLADVGVTEVVNHEAILDLTAPPEKAQGRVLEGEHAATVPELVRLLHDEAKAV
jgi:electron transfer flavoprotein beta subunit